MALTLSKEAHVMHSAAGLPVDENTRPELVDFGGKLLRSENSRQTSRGSVIKRNGFAAMPTIRYDASGAQTFSSAGYKLFANGQTVVRITDTLNAEEYLGGLISGWRQMGKVPEVGVTTTGLPSVMSAATLGVEDIEHLQLSGSTPGFFAVATKATTNTGTDGSLTFVDDTGTVAGGPLPGFSRTFLGSVSGRYFVSVSDRGTSLLVQSWDTFVPVTGPFSSFTVATDFGGGDFAVCSLPDRVAIAYINNTGGTSRVSVVTVSQSAQLQTTTINTSSTTPNCVDVRLFPGGTLFVAWDEGTSIKMQGLTGTALTTVLATTAVVMTVTTLCSLLSISPSSTTGGRVFANSVTQISTVAHTNGYTTTAGAVAQVGTTVTLHNVIHCARPMFLNGRHYTMVIGGNLSTSIPLVNTQKVLTLVEWTDAKQFVRPVANFAPGLAVGAGLGKVKIVPGSTSTTFYTGIGVQRSSTAVGAELVTLDFADTRRWMPAAFGGSTYLSGGLLSYYDGVRVAEAGFMIRPPSPTRSIGAGTGYTGTVRYVAVYEEVDADGNWHVSGVSDPTSPITLANQTILVQVPPLTITARVQSTLLTATPNVRIAIYRTITGGVPPYYRLTTVANDVTQDSVSYTDSTTDLTLSANAQLYEQPGLVGTAQDRRAPPSLNIIATYNGMLVGASDSDLWYSGQNVSGEGVWFNPVFQVPIPGDGPITGLAALDGTLFIFKRRDVFAIAGDPPSDNGSSGGLGTPRRIAADVGCIEPRSTCTTSLGIFFQSDRGIEILTRAQSVEWIGEPYQNTIAANPVCTSITVEPVSNTVLVELATSQSGGVVSGTGCTLVYDLSMKQWVSKDIRLSGTPSQSACIVPTSAGPRYGWITNAGQVYTETPGTSLDAGAWITMLIETANARHGLQQRQRVWNAMALFSRPDAAGLKIEIAYDYAGYTETKTWTETETLGSVQLETRPKSEHAAIRFRLSDTQPVTLGTGQGLTFIGLSLDMAQKQGATQGTPHLNPALRK